MNSLRYCVRLLQALLLLGVLGVASSAVAQQAMIETEYLGPASLGPGDEFEVLAKVVSNTTAQTPTAFALRYQYNSASVQYVSTTAAATGWSTFVGPEEGSGAVFRDIVGFNFSNASTTPQLVKVKFQVVAGSPATPFAITVVGDPGTALNLADINNVPLPLSIDSAPTSSLVVTDTGVATIATSITGDATTVGTSFDVDLDVVSSGSLFTPRRAQLRVTYNPQSVSYVSSTAGDLGGLTVGPEVLVDANTARRTVHTADTPANADKTPSLGALTFQTQNAPVVPHSIVIASDPASPAPLLAVDGVNAIQPVYDNTATTNLVVIDPGAARIRTTIVSGTPLQMGAEFDVLVEIDNNGSGTAPGIADLRLRYPADSVAFVKAFAGDLGALTVGSETSLGGSARGRVIATAGNAGNADLTPSIFTARFRVLPGALVPFSIIIEDNPGAAVNLGEAANFNTSIFHGFTSVGTQSLNATNNGFASVETSVTNASAGLDLAGTTFDVPVNIVNNTTGLIPRQASFLITYDTDAVSLTGTADGTLGAITLGPPTAVSGSIVSQKITTDNSGTNASPNALLGTFSFQVANPPVHPFDILVSNDPDAQKPLLATDGTTNIPRTFNNSATQGLGVPPPVEAVIKTTLAGDSSTPGSQFTVEVAVDQNATGFTPRSAALRVAYNTASVELVSASAGDLGALLQGAEETVTGTSVFTDILTDGSAANASATPLIFTLTFEVKAGAFTPYSILVGPDPDSTAPLLASNLIDSIPVTYDNTATTNLTATPGTGAAIVQTNIVAGDPSVAGGTFDVLVSVASNDTGLAPGAAAFRVTYETDSVELLSVGEEDLGPVLIGPEEQSGSLEFTDILTQSNVGNTSLIPAVYLLRFQVKANAYVPFSITVDADPGSTKPLIANDLLTSIPVIFDNTNTIDIPGPSTPGGNAVVRTEIVSGDPSVPGSTLDVLIDVASNPTGLAPNSAALRLSYDTASLTFVGATAGDLGSLLVGPEEPLIVNGSAVTRDILTDGSSGNTALLPDVMTVSFLVNASPFVPFSIMAADDPQSSVPLLASDLATAIPHVFNNDATSNLTGPAGTTAVVQSTVVSGDPTQPGADFSVLVRVASNPTAFTPAAAAFRVTFDPGSVSFEGVAGGELGAPTVGPIETSGSLAFVDILTQSNASNADTNADVYTLNFKVNANPFSPYNIAVSDDPGSTVPLLATDLISSIPHLFNNAGISNIVVDFGPGGADAVIQGVVSSGDPSVAGGQFDVLARVASNPAGTVPVSGALRVVYDTASVSFIGASDGELGAVQAGAEEVIGGTLVSRDILTQSNNANTDILADIFTLTFETNANAPTPFAIVLQDDPDSTAPLLATDFATAIPHTFDNTQTSALADGACLFFSLTPDTENFAAAGGTGSFTITGINTSCAYTATANDPWITIDAGGSGTGVTNTLDYSVAANVGPARTGTISVNGAVFTVTQDDGCSFVLAPTSENFTEAGGSSSFTVTASDPTCAWTAVASDPFISIVSGAGTGDGSVSFTVAANTGAARSGSISVGNATFSITQDPGCTYTLVPNSANYTAAGGGGSFDLSTNAGCPWTVVSNDPYITVTSAASGNGPATITYTVAANMGPARSGSITAGGQTFTVTQEDGCMFALSTDTETYTAAGGTGSFDVLASDPACAWSAVSNDPFITITNGAAGIGDGTVEYSVAATAGPARIGTITAAGLTFTVVQEDGCTYVLNPTSDNFTAAGGAGAFTVTASDTACTYTVTTAADWIALNTFDVLQGSVEVDYTVAANDGPARTATIDVADQVFTVTQDGGCTVAISPSTGTFDANGGAGSFNVTSGVGCTWTATTSDAFITITSPAAGAGTGSAAVQYTVAANTGANRTGTITVDGQTHTITQTAPAPILAATPSLIQSTAVEGASPANGSFQISNVGIGVVNYLATDDQTWMSVSPTSGSLASGASATITVAFATTSLAPGTHVGRIQVEDIDGVAAPTFVTVAVTIDPATSDPLIVLNPSFATPTTAVTVNPPDTTFAIQNTGTATLNYSTSVSYRPGTPSGWLSSVSPATGSIPAAGQANVTLAYDIDGIDGGLYNAFVQVNDEGGTAAPRTFIVSLEVTGSLDTGPTVTIASPATDMTVDHNVVSLPFNGTASGNKSITDVRWRINTGAFTSASNDSGDFTSWSFIVNLAPGNNTIEVQATDSDGVRGPIVSRTIDRFAADAQDLIVLTKYTDIWASINDIGTLTPPFQYDFIGFRHDLAGQYGVFQGDGSIDPAHGGPWKTVSGDFDGDSFLDLATITEFGDVWLYLSDSATPTPTKVSTGWSIDEDLGFSVFAGDFDRDGLTDLAQINASGDVFVGYNTGGAILASTFVASTSLALDPANGLWIEAVDMDGDGRTDLVQIDSSDGEISVAHSSPTTGFDPVVSLGVTGFRYDLANKAAIHFGDFNGDGRTDVAAIDDDVVNEDGNTVAMVALSNAAGTALLAPEDWGTTGFHNDPVRGVDSDGTPTGWWVLTGEINGDGLTDLIQINSFGEVWVATSNGTSFDGSVKNATIGFNHQPEGPWQVFVGRAFQPVP
ncbi:MAG: hypothetical protein PWP23_2840 [Candidatus Sumerlaeota bacterium]|nr:hypothetical protein [Candidatus Sumerlaeota bacterium]